MPRVSAQHLEARRDQILEAAWRCFDRNGFHATTMAHVIAESGLSAGAVYRYYTGKEDLIRATVERALGAAGAAVQRLVEEDEPDLAAGVAGVIEAIRPLMEGETDVSRIALMAWAESLQSDSLRELTSGAQAILRGHLARLAERARDAGRLPADADPEAVGQVLLSLLIGMVVQRLLFATFDVPAYVDAVRALERADLTGGP